MRFVYADPPYLGCGKLYAKNHPEAMVWNDPQTHRELVERLCADWPDGWAMICSTPSLRVLLPFTPADCRVGAWVKPFAIFKPNVNPAYAWEPVIFRGGRKRDRTQDTARDWHSENITLRKGLTGAKPPKFGDWILALLGVDFAAGDTIDDLFPGTHGLTRAWAEKREPSQLLMESAESEMGKPTFQQIIQAVARGWCHQENSGKEMDAHLAAAISREVQAVFAPSATPCIAPATLMEMRAALRFYANDDHRVWVTFKPGDRERVLRRMKEEPGWIETGEDSRGHEEFIETGARAQAALDLLTDNENDAIDAAMRRADGSTQS